jgi:hypothetical protein
MIRKARAPRSRAARDGLSLVDALVATLVVAVLGAAVFVMLTATTRDSHRLRSDVLVRQLGLDILERQAAGGAREVLLQGVPRSGDGSVERELAGTEWQSRLLAAEVTLLLPLDLRITLAVKPLAAALQGRPVGPAELSVTLAWSDPDRRARSLVVRTVTDTF